ncbi:MAG: DNA polymerase III subunit alpha [candidate division BRC1 bacterium ADurb.BinA364]|nr:MAG: DNA polymerase III subunit alpha [candidate division BRC1 bacterium ADurb.BinA364]
MFRGPARGVWQASALAYALGLSRLNPVVFHLPEPEWKGGAGAPPPFRMEIAEEDLESAREAFERFLGDNHVGRVGRWPARGRKALLRDLGRRFGVSEAKLKRLLAEEPRTARQRRKAEKAKEGNGNGHGNGHGAAGEARIDDAAFLRAAAETLDGAPSGLRPDGCSFVFSGQDIEESVPFEPLRDAGPVSQFDAEALDYFGLPWMELTPRPAASVIKAALRHIWEHEAPKFRIEEAPLDDAEAFAALGMGRIGGLPELNSISTRALLRAAPPSSLIELAEMFRHSSAGAEAETGEGKPDLSASLPSALLAYWAAYLKARHGAAFMAASLTRAASSPKPLAILLRETRRLGLDILPPHINFSRFEFSPEHKGIRTGLSVVRQFGPIAYAELDRERQGRPFDDLVDLCRRTDSRILNHRTIGNLVKAGALDCFGSPRSHLLAALDAIFRDVRMEREKEEEIAGQPTLFDMNELERKIPGEDAQLDEMPEFSLEKRLRLEREAAGYFVSVDPFDFYRELTKQLKARPAADIRKSDIGRNAFIVGYIDAQETEGPLISESTVAALDCEGTIVRVARGARSCIGPSLACEGPVLMGAIGRRREKDLYWEVWTIHSMDDVWRLARQVERIILDPAGLDERRAREIADLLKSYRGTTKVVLDRTRGEAPRAGKIDGASTLFCPPVHLGLLAHLPASQIRILDGEGHAPKLPEAAILE